MTRTNSEDLEKTMTQNKTLQATDLKIGHVSIRCIAHPEWGTWGVTRRTDYEGNGTWWTILGDRGSRTLMDTELKFWELV